MWSEPPKYQLFFEIEPSDTVLLKELACYPCGLRMEMGWGQDPPAATPAFVPEVGEELYLPRFHPYIS